MRILAGNHFKNALDSLGSNRARSLLTIIGIAIGIASIVTILSLSGGLQQLVGQQISEVGGNIIVVRPNSNRSSNEKNAFTSLTTSRTYSSSSLTEADLTSIKKIESIEAIAPLAISEHDLTGDNKAPATTVVSTNPDLDEIVKLPLEDGQFLEDTLSGRSAVIGNSLSLDLFDTVHSIGKTFYVKGEAFMVVGVLSKLDNSINYNNVDFDYAALINIKSTEMINDNLQIQQINIKTANTNVLESTSTEINDILLKNHKGEADFSVLYGESISHPTEELFSVVSTMMTIVATISLIVGGVGVMNIMLVSVAERTHEIGIRKAVGASNWHILMQFLFEALILCALGGLFGFLFGYAFAFGLSTMLPFNPSITNEIVCMAAIVSLIIGCIFGIYPAIKAARKNPIDSLRNYR